jgi:DNA-binding transcriptional ArsR family regulator
MLRIYTGEWERDLVRQGEQYLHQTFGAVSDWHSAPQQGLPHYLADRYRLWHADLMGRPALFMAPRPTDLPGVEELARQVAQVRTRYDAPLVILAFAHLGTSRRHALIAQRLAFLVPGAQLFVPELLLDLRERPPAPPRVAETLSPTAQVVILGALLDLATEGNAGELARRYGVAPMSMTRAFDELAGAHLAETPRVGRERVLRFQVIGRALWEQAAPRLQSPVRKVRTVVIPLPQRFPGKIAGESALGRYTALTGPRIQRLAVASADWNRLVRDEGLRDTEPLDPQGDEVETWTYDPAALTSEMIVDPLSLYLSVRGHTDERVAGAAEDLLERMPWW